MAKTSRPSKREKELLATIGRLEGIIARQEATIEQLTAKVAKLTKQVEDLQAQLAKSKKNSSNSSKPPSSDIVNPKKTSSPKGTGKRRAGAQPGHDKHERKPFDPEEIDQTHDYRLDACPDCGGYLIEADTPPRIIDQIELETKPIRIDRHQGLPYWCSKCQKIHYAPLPSEVKKGGLIGPGLTALIGYMKGVCHASFSTIRKYLRDVAGVTISRGQLRKIMGKVSQALEEPWLQLLGMLPFEEILNVDETGHKDNGDQFWTWCFRAHDYTLFKIADTRGSKVLFEVLGEEFNGVLGCDYFSAYRKYMKDCGVLVQFCLAHLIRDLKFLAAYPEKETRAYGQRLLDAVRDMFGLIHRRDGISEAEFDKALAEQREIILNPAANDAPDKCHVRPIVKRFVENGDSYFRFITTPGIEPTNNLAEQAIRFVVIDRRITQGTRSDEGQRWCERIWSVVATCARQGRSAYDFILQAVQAHFQGRPAPSLLNSS